MKACQQGLPLLILLLLTLPEFLHHQAEAAVQSLDTASVAQLWRSGYAYLDVRTPQEFAAGHVPRALNVPWVSRDAATGR
jgi:3-mercaptopyruvate sulfurtransferase SseA